MKTGSLNTLSTIKFYENPTNGTNFVSLGAPTSITSDIAWVLPPADGTIGQALKTDGSGNLGWVTVLSSNETITLSGDVSGSGTTAITTTLASVGTAGTYKSVTTDAKGRVTAGTNPTTLSGFGITDAVNTSLLGANNGVATLDSGGKLSSSQIPALAISDTFVVSSEAAMLALTAQTGDVAVRTDESKTYVLKGTDPTTLADWQEMLTPTGTITISGDASGSGTTAITLTLASVGTAGTYTQVTTDAKGRVTSGSNPTTLSGYGITDAVNSSLLGANNGVATLDSGGKLTSSQIPSINLTSNVTGTLPIGNGGTNITTYSTGDILYASASNTLSTLPAATNGQVLTLSAGIPSWTTPTTGTVTSVSLSSSSLDVSGSPITSSGSITVDIPTQSGLTPASGYNNFTVNSNGIITAASTVSYLTGNQNITISGDASGSGTTAITLTLASIGTAGTYKSVTTDSQGRVTAGTNPTTLSGFGITDAQPLNTGLTNFTTLVNGGTTGLIVQTGVNTFVDRTITGTTNQITLTNGSGVSGNPVIALASNPVIPGTASVTIPAGTTAQRPGSPTTGMMRYNTDTSQYETYQSSNWVSFSSAVQTITYASSLTINWDLGDYAVITLTGNSTIDMSGLRSKVILVVKQDATGSRLVTWGSNVRFGSDIATVALSSAPSKEDKIGFVRDPVSGKYDCVSYVRGF